MAHPELDADRACLAVLIDRELTVQAVGRAQQENLRRRIDLRLRRLRDRLSEAERATRDQRDRQPV